MESGAPTSRRDVKQRIIVMARWPEAGKAKTRLIPALGPNGAADLHSCLAHRTFNTVRQFAALHSCQIDIQFTGGAERDMSQLFGDDLAYTRQQGESLGDRISHAVQQTFAEGGRRVVVIGTDCPELQVSHLEEAFLSLQHRDVTIGPAVDGGYYLIGIRDYYPALFENIHWGTETVLEETLQTLRRIQKTWTLLPTLSDVDFPEDLIICRQFVDSFAQALPQREQGLLSIIVPTLNEEAGLAELLQNLVQEAETEIIVVDGESSDATCEIAERAGVKLIRCGRGRARQMNAGAALARGETLLFLHADSRLPANFRQTIRECMETGHIAGAFRLRIDDPRWVYRLIEFGANLRTRLLKLPYGDQSVFIQSDNFFAMNGFQNWPLLEDLDFAHRLRRTGRVLIADSSTTTSARRWQRIGAFRTTLTNQVIITAYQLGISPTKLAALYTRLK